MPEAERRLRLNPERESAILDAVRDLIAETGYDAMRIDHVAARAHASKATIYRRWEGKADLATAVMMRMSGVQRERESSGDLRADLVQVMYDHVTSKRHDDEFIAGIASSLQRDDELREKVRVQLVQPFSDAVARALAWAVERGELGPDILAHRLLPEMLPAMCMRRKWLDVDQSDDEFYAELLDTMVLPMLRGLSQPTVASSTG